MEAVFRALGDASRRRLLDRLFERDGQTLSELQERMGMTRFGVMKHLRVLEEAGLVTTRRSGREKLHYLNPVPIRLAHDRWISKYAEPWVGAMSELKNTLEAASMSEPMHVYQVYIRTTADQLWRAITDGEITRKYFFGTTAESDWKPGSTYQMVAPDGAVPVWGKVLESEPNRRLVHTFEHSFSEQEGGDSVGASRVVWDIEQMGAVCKLTLTHDEFGGATKTYESTGEGWPIILSGLKTLLETGESLVIPERDAATA